MAQYTRNTNYTEDATSRAAGGAHVDPVLGGLVIDETLTYDGIWALLDVQRMTGPELQWQTLGGEAEAFDVGELQAPGETQLVHGVETVESREFASWVTLTKQYLRDADRDGRRQQAIATKVAEGFRKRLEVNAIGANAGSPQVSHFGSSILNDVTATTAVTANDGVALRDAINSAVVELELSAGVTGPVQVLLNNQVKSLALTNNRRGTGSNELLFNRPEEVVGDRRFSYTQHFSTAGGIATGDTLAVIGQFGTDAFGGIHEDLELDIHTSGNTPSGINLATQRAVGFAWAMRGGFKVLEPAKLIRLIAA